MEEPETEPSPSIREVLEETRQRERPRIEASRREPSRTVVGEVLEVSEAPRRALIRFEDGSGETQEQWLGVVRGLELRPGDHALVEKPGNWPRFLVTSAIDGDLAEEPVELEPQAREPTTVEVDGQRVEIEGHDEIVLRCGQASITLRRNGRLIIRGTYVETRSKGVNRIKGGSVQIN